MLAIILEDGQTAVIGRQTPYRVIGDSNSFLCFARSLVVTPTLGFFPQLNVEIEQEWSGILGVSVDGMPWVGRVPHTQGLFVAGAHCGPVSRAAADTCHAAGVWAPVEHAANCCINHCSGYNIAWNIQTV